MISYACYVFNVEVGVLHGSTADAGYLAACKARPLGDTREQYELLKFRPLPYDRLTRPEQPRPVDCNGGYVGSKRFACLHASTSTKAEDKVVERTTSRSRTRNDLAITRYLVQCTSVPVVRS